MNTEARKRQKNWPDFHELPGATLQKPLTALGQRLAERTGPLHQRQSFYSFNSLKEEKKKSSSIHQLPTQRKSPPHISSTGGSAQSSEESQGRESELVVMLASQQQAGGRAGNPAPCLWVGEKVTEGTARNTALWQRGQEPLHGLPASC